MESSARVIGHYRGEEPGPLLIACGGLHGNEYAGVAALERLFELLEEEPKVNPGFTFRGELLALRGNLEALTAGKRFVERDLNRIWMPDAPLRAADGTFASVEDREADGLLAVIEHAAAQSPLAEVIFLDLHTTTAGGGIFAVVPDEARSFSLAAEIGVPLITGMTDSLGNTAMEYFRRHFANRGGRAITFEAGQHDDPNAVDCALAATVNVLRAAGCVLGEDVSTHYDETLRAAARGLPPLTRLAYVHVLERDVNPDFTMHPGYGNYSPVTAGQPLATLGNRVIESPCDGYLLMPHYQKIGREAFFIVQKRPPASGY